ncbi:hypothetical protein [Limisalsivibrio acetivorans]|uniref:hypothetical protein n=1 Tax=Limisalsivibrio acetivorans TaxID=1304888 RepID=UPI0003B4A3D5|nr:hypothetical protein [Limisalsivibrio acetivorans]
MPPSSENRTLLKDNKLLRIEGGSADFPADTDELSSGYTLFVDDSYFFWLSMELPQAGKKKTDAFVRNYLSTFFPENMLTSYGYVQRDGKAYIYVLAPALVDLIETNPQIFRKAGSVTTPMLELIAKNSDFRYHDGNRVYSISDSLITQQPENPDEMDTPLTFEDGIRIEVTAFNMKLPGVGREKLAIEKYKVPAAVLLIAYVLFATGEYFYAKAAQNDLEAYEKRLNKIYIDTGVATKADPYGSLLFHAKGGGDTSGGIDVLDTLELISDSATKGKVGLESLVIKENSVTCTGKAVDFQSVEGFKTNLETNGGVTASVDDTDKIEDGIKFVVRFDQ